MFFQSYLIFISFYIYHFFYVPEYLTSMYLLCASVGPVRPVDFARTRWRPRPKAGPSAVVRTTATMGGSLAREAERVLRWVEQNLTALTRTVPMVEIEDLPLSMQPHVVGVPQTWVQLLWNLTNVVVHHGMDNKPCP